MSLFLNKTPGAIIDDALAEIRRIDAEIASLRFEKESFTDLIGLMENEISAVISGDRFSTPVSEMEMTLTPIRLLQEAGIVSFERLGRCPRDQLRQILGERYFLEVDSAWWKMQIAKTEAGTKPAAT